MLHEPLQRNIQEYEDSMELPKDPIDCSAKSLIRNPQLKKIAETDFAVTMIALELQGAMNVGGVGAAVLGMAKNLAENRNRVRVILPKYDTLPLNIQMRRKDKYQLYCHGKNLNVYKSTINGIKCYFIDDPEHFAIGLSQTRFYYRHLCKNPIGKLGIFSKLCSRFGDKIQ